MSNETPETQRKGVSGENKSKNQSIQVLCLLRVSKLFGWPTLSAVFAEGWGNTERLELCFLHGQQGIENSGLYRRRGCRLQHSPGLIHRMKIWRASSASAPPATITSTG